MQKSQRLCSVRFRQVAFVFVFLAWVGGAAGEDRCALLLRDGIYNHLELKRTDSWYSDMRKYFKSDKFQRDAKSEKWKFNASIPVGDVLIGLSGESDSQSVQEFQESVERLDESHFERFCDLFVREATPNIAAMAEYRKCLAEQYSIGFATNVHGTGRYRIFEITYRSQKPEDSKPRIKVLRIIGTKSTPITSLREGAEIEPSQLITVERDPKNEIVVHIETDRGIVHESIAADPQAAPPPRPEVITIAAVEAVNRGNSTGLRVNPIYGEGVVSANDFTSKNRDMRLSATYSVDAAKGGKYLLDFKYAVGGGQDRAVTVQINGAGVGTIGMPDTGGWMIENQRWTSTRLEVSLLRGHNTLQLIRDMPNANTPAFPHLTFIRLKSE